MLSPHQHQFMFLLLKNKEQEKFAEPREFKLKLLSRCRESSDFFIYLTNLERRKKTEEKLLASPVPA